VLFLFTPFVIIAWRPFPLHEEGVVLSEKTQRSLAGHHWEHRTFQQKFILPYKVRDRAVFLHELLKGVGLEIALLTSFEWRSFPVLASA